ncbi:hypothetical protein BK126_03030 [Paenibacillus sp. FSL H7-0326]|uniref:right-handed parallel beta-helix repeat-containing protein n=1 Tax=Paenibacillus sp. FSL H7-0326 TaxID=1921144 RepID=UPI00096F4A9C|nr:right-handed parallel beta-helix repeat-containing protein [Paenibacillus sp. FSL H7-0326]OMC71101.1 hypothetical protein BK126_03030 [Paenibacillus sp. FSL H7-0326]
MKKKKYRNLGIIDREAKTALLRSEEAEVALNTKIDRKEYDVYEYGASGSDLEFLSDINSGETHVKLIDHDFDVGNGVCVFKAGNVCTLTPPQINLSTGGVTGNTNYQYRISVIDEKGGQSAVGPLFSISTGNAFLSSANFNRLSWEPVPGAVGYVIYGRSGTEMKYLAVTGLSTWYDTGAIPRTPPITIAQTVPLTPSRGVFRSEVTSTNNEGIQLKDALKVNLNNAVIHHDDTDSFVNAINDSFKGNKKVVVPPGQFNLFDDVIIHTKMNIYGNGDESVVRSVLPFNNVFYSNNTEGVRISNLKIVGNGYGLQPINRKDDPNAKGSGSGIVMARGKGFKISKVTVLNCGGDGNTSERNGVAGIWATYGCESYSITDNDVRQCRNGINEDNYYQRDPLNGYIARNYVEKCRFGIVTDNSDKGRGLRIADNVVRKCAYSGIDINKSSYVDVYHNTVEECGDILGREYKYWEAETTYQKDDVIAANGRFYKAKTAGTTAPILSSPVSPSHVNGSVVDGTVEWEYVTGTFAPAIHMYSSANFRMVRVKVRKNQLINNFWTAIKGIQNLRYCRIEENEIDGCGNHGIQVQAFRYGSVSRNEVYNAAGSGIHGTPVSIDGTTVSIDRTKFVENQVSFCYQHGIYLEAAYYCHIIGNESFNNSLRGYNQYSGISIGGGTVYAKIMNNTVDGDQQRFGIAIVGSTTINNDIAGNTSRNNAGPTVDYGIENKQQIFGTNRNTNGVYDHTAA